MALFIKEREKTDHSFGGSPVKKAGAAVNLVIKHKGADFLEPKAVMSISWYQELGYDILIFVLLCTFLFFCVVGMSKEKLFDM